MQHDKETISMSAQELLEQGLRCYHEKNLNNALFYLEHLVKIDSDNTDLLYTIAQLLQEMNRYRDALVYTGKLIEISPRTDDFFLAHAESYFFLHDYVKALPLYLNLHESHPLNSHILNRLLTIYNVQKKRGEVKKVEILLSEIERKTHLISYEIEESVKAILLLVEKGKTEEAYSLIESVLLLDVDNVHVNGIYGALLKDDGQYEKAIKHLDKIAYEPSGEYLSAYVDCMERVRGISAVTGFLVERVNKYPNEHKAKKMLGLCYYKNKEYIKAYDALRLVSKYYSEDLSFLKAKAISRFMAIDEEKKWLDADKLAASAVELHAIYRMISDDEDVLVQLLIYYLNIGDIKTAYEITCNGQWRNEDVREWNKHPYFIATRDKASYFSCYLSGRSRRQALYSINKVKEKVWNGESLVGKNVVILREQGVGDEIYFASNYQWVIQQAASVSAFCSGRLKEAFERLFPSVFFHALLENNGLMQIVESEHPLIDSADFIIFAGDLPALHYKKYSFSLYNKEYYSVKESLKEFWKKTLTSSVFYDRPKVGLAWRSGLVNSSRTAHYLTADEMAEVIKKLPEVEFVNCMYVECKKEIGIIQKKSGRKIHHFKNLDQKNDFENTAAMISNLDLMVGAHIAPIILAQAVGTNAVIYGSDYVNEDGIIEKESLNYPGTPHISLPLSSKEKRAEALDAIVKSIRASLNL